MKKVITTLAAAAALAMATSAMADHRSFDSFGYGRPVFQTAYGGHHPLAGLREINFRQEEQRARIERGFHRGAITHWEFRRLMAEQRDIQAMERAFVADGFLAPHERAELHRRLDIASSHIFFEAHDHQRRF
jgi:Spy/CpxP family protein refolding chaperone